MCNLKRAKVDEIDYDWGGVIIDTFSTNLMRDRNIGLLPLLTHM